MADQRCPATTRFDSHGVQCKFSQGHDGDHCAPATWAEGDWAGGDVFWADDAQAPPDDEELIRRAMEEAADHPGRIVTVND